MPSSHAVARATTLVALIFFFSLHATVASAWTINNNTTRSVKFKVYETDWTQVPQNFSSTSISAGASVSCGYGNTDCNPNGGRRQALYAVIWRDAMEWGCAVTLPAHGFVNVEEEDRSAIDNSTPDMMWCRSLITESNADQDMNGDGDQSDTIVIDWSDAHLENDNGSGDPWNPLKRDVRFLITGDPQFHHVDLENVNGTAYCDYEGECVTESNTPSAKAEDVLKEMRKQLKATRTLSTRTYDRRNSRYRGAIVAGDLTQKIRWDEWKAYIRATTGTWDQRIRRADQFKFYDGLGNHDAEEQNAEAFICGDPVIDLGYYDCAQKANEYVVEHEKSTPPSNTDWSNGNPHYSWDWHDVHFVQLNIFPSDTETTDADDPGVIRDPLEAMTFLANDLSTHVGSSGRPVVLIHHYGFDTFATGDSNGEVWWTDDQRQAYWNALTSYNVIGIFNGHEHGGIGWDAADLSRLNANGNARPGWNARTTDTRDTIEAFNSGAALNGIYLDVKVRCGKMTVTQKRLNQGGLQADVVDIDEASGVLCDPDPSPVCGLQVVELNHLCLADTDLRALSGGTCQQLGIDLVTSGEQVQSGDVICSTPGYQTLSCAQNYLNPPIVQTVDNSPPYAGNVIDLPAPIPDTYYPTGDCDIPSLPANLECGVDNIGGYGNPTNIYEFCTPSSVTVSCGPQGAQPAYDDNVVCDLTDGNGNSGTCATTFPGFRDSLPPVVSLADATPIVHECGTTISDPGGASAADACEGTVSTSASISVDPNNVGTGSIAYSASDSLGQTGDVTRTVNVVDTIRPSTIDTAVLPPYVVECNTPFVDPGASAFDQCEGSIIATVAFSDVDEATPGAYTHRYRVADSSGNARTRNVSVSVVDTLAPSITSPADTTLSCGVAPGQLGIPVVSDSCVAPGSIVTTNDAPASFPLGTTLVTWTATDPGSNFATDTQNVTITDVAPALNAPPNIQLACDTSAGVTELGLGTPSLSDDCTASPSLTNDAPAGGTYPLGETTVTWTANDGVNPDVTDTQRVTIVPDLACDPGGTMYVRGTGPQRTLAVEQSDASTLPIGSLTLEGGLAGFAADPASGTLFAIANGDTHLYSIDRVTGAATSLGEGGGEMLTLAGLAYDSRAQLLYASDAGSLYEIDPTNGARSLVGNSLPALSGLAYDAGADVLYGVAGSTFDSLYEVDRTTGAITLIGALGFDAGIVGLSFDGTSRTLYVSDARTDSLYSVNTSTGQATLVGGLAGLGTPDALAFVPEPGFGIGVAVGVSLLLGTTRRRISQGSTD